MEDAAAPSSDLSIVVLAAGKGTRMRSERPKVLHELCGRPMIGWVLDEVRALAPARAVLVVGSGAEEVEAAARAEAGDLDLQVVVQEPQRGTGHAVQVALPALPEGPGRVVVLYGDMPLLRAASVRALLEEAARTGPGGLALLTLEALDPRGYGRIVRDAGGGVRAIVEDRDATPEQKAIREVNLGVYAFDAQALRADLPRLSDDNAQGELYLTDVLAIAVGDGRDARALALADPGEGLGVNTLSQLAEVRHEIQMRILEEHMAAGVRVVDPATTYVEHGVEIGAGTTLLPCTVIHAGVRIGEHCEVGPFTHLRPGTVLEEGAEVGNFTECKNSTLGSHSKAKHLSYLGDTHIGARANIGAGTIFANYDGKAKHRTEVGDRAFIGSGTIVVAPNVVPADTITGAGAVLTRSARMQPGEVWVGLPARRLPPRDPA